MTRILQAIRDLIVVAVCALVVIGAVYFLWVVLRAMQLYAQGG